MIETLAAIDLLLEFSILELHQLNFMWIIITMEKSKN